MLDNQKLLTYHWHTTRGQVNRSRRSVHRHRIVEVRCRGSGRRGVQIGRGCLFLEH